MDERGLTAVPMSIDRKLESVYILFCYDDCCVDTIEVVIIRVAGCWDEESRLALAISICKATRDA